MKKKSRVVPEVDGSQTDNLAKQVALDCLGFGTAELLPERRFGLGGRGVCSCACCGGEPVPATSTADSATREEEKDKGDKGHPETCKERGERPS